MSNLRVFLFPSGFLVEKALQPSARPEIRRSDAISRADDHADHDVDIVDVLLRTETSV